jgi:hypothetical protein
MLTNTLLLLFLAHDFWIEPASYSPQRGQILSVRLRVGQELLGDPVPRDPKLLKQFVVTDGAASRPLIGRDGSDPAGYLRVDGNGLMVIGYASNPSAVEMPVEKFTQYLKEEGLDGISVRARRNQTELFSRCAKSLVLSGAANRQQADRTLGFTLELVAERNPYALHAGDELPVRLTYLGKPLAGAQVTAMSREQKLLARTDAEGRARFRLPQSGMWMLKSVHMIPAAKADWESFWASLTFEVPK